MVKRLILKPRPTKEYLKKKKKKIELIKLDISWMVHNKTQIIGEDHLNPLQGLLWREQPVPPHSTPTYRTTCIFPGLQSSTLSNISHTAIAWLY